MQESYDLIVIGGGSAGLTAARFGAQLGLRVALAEMERVGGDCTWTGCIPSKSLVRAGEDSLRHALCQSLRVERGGAGRRPESGNG